MTRTEYIRQLMEALSFLPEDSRREAAAFYTEMLDDRMEDGMEEEMAVAAMEDPQEIARRIREEGGYGEENPEKTGSAEKDILQSALDMASKACKLAEEAVEKADIAKRVEKAFQDAEKMHQSQNGKQGDYQEKTFSVDASVIRAIRLEASNMPIRILPSEDAKMHLIYYTCERDPYEAGVEYASGTKNGMLYLRHIGCAPSGFFRFSFHFGWVSKPVAPTVRLLIPRDALVDLFAETSNASIKVEDLSALCDTVLHTSNARIALENVKCKALDIRSSNGRLALTAVDVKAFVQGKTSNGRIVTQHLSCNGKIDLTTSNGRIEADIIKAEEISLRTSNGSLSASLPGKQQDWQIDSGTSNGKSNLPKFQAGQKPLYLHTSNGSLQADFKE